MSTVKDSSPGPITHAEDEDQSYLSYVGSETPKYITVTWVLVTGGLLYYTWVWYLPELSLWMGWG